MFRRRSTPITPSDRTSSGLFSDKTFYKAFIRDMRNCTTSIVIESPFITTRRMHSLLPELNKLLKRDIKVIINTRYPSEHDNVMHNQAEDAVSKLQGMGFLVLFTAGLHRKLAIIDGGILWEGSLNILSQNDSCEVMRRNNSDMLCEQMIEFTRLGRWYRCYTEDII